MSDQTGGGPTLLRERLHQLADSQPGGGRIDGVQLYRQGLRLRRRRRIGVAAAAAACGVLVASIAAFGVGGMVDTTGRPASESEDGSDGGIPFEVTSAWPPAEQTYALVREVVFDQTAYGEHAGMPREDAWSDAGLADGFGYEGGESADRTRLTNVGWDRRWQENERAATLYVNVFSPEEGGRWSSTWMTQCDPRRPGLFPTCEERTTGGGKTVLVGIDRGPRGLWMRVHWKQPDGTFVEAGFSGPHWNAPPDPSLTIGDLMNVATDPRLTILND
jgi:Protein of unknown function (DUF2613)